MPSLHRTVAVLLALATALAAATWTPGAGAAGLGEERRTAVRATARGTVTALDAAGRSLTVRGPRAENTYRVDPKVKTLEALKVGDTVRVDYVAGIGLTVRRGDGAPAPTATREQGATQRTTFVTPVLSIDRSRGTVKLQGLEGQPVDYKVDDRKDLVGVRVGDKVTAVVYELVAVEVAPASK